ncbi:MAG TPA: VWA domain-containing protein [Thermoanaerobaculia bacterium]|jgi:VWFA-related protein|nr:VWA domain-containing protein [Thermoanaerobaculia bacterium]
MHGRILLIGSIVAALPLASAQAQAGDKPAPTFGETVEVRVVNVETVVVDAANQPVHGLTKADFRLLVDGKEVPIDHFDEVLEASAATAPPAAATPGVPTPPTEVARALLVLVDDSFAVQAPRNAALQSLGRELSTLGAADQAAVVAFDGRRLDTLASWTSDRRVLADALAAAAKRPALGSRFIAEDRGMGEDVDLTIEAALEAGLDPDELGMVTAPLYKRVNPAARTQLRRTTDAMAGALRGFETPPGRKVLVLLTGGWSTRVAPQLFGPLVESANRLGYTLYAVDVATNEPAATKALDALARATGGRDASGLGRKLLATISRDAGSYYWLGFDADFRGNDSVHKVEVQVLRPGLRVRSRSSYSDVSGRTETSMRAEGVSLFGGAPEDKRLIVIVEGTKDLARKKHEVELAVTLGVPVEALSFSPAPEGGFLAEVPLAILALDKDGGRSEIASRLRVALSGAPPTQGLARFRTTVKLRRVDQRVVFTVEAADGRFLWGDTELKF